MKRQQPRKQQPSLFFFTLFYKQRFEELHPFRKAPPSSKMLIWDIILWPCYGFFATVYIQIVVKTWERERRSFFWNVWPGLTLLRLLDCNRSGRQRLDSFSWELFCGRWRELLLLLLPLHILLSDVSFWKHEDAVKFGDDGWCWLCPNCLE